MTNRLTRIQSKARIGAVAGAMAGLMFVVSADAQMNSRAEVFEKVQSYCCASWRNARIPRDDWDDCTQQVILELLERMNEQDLGEAISNTDCEQRRELNRAVWRISKRTTRRTSTVPLNGYDVADQQTSIEIEEREQKLTKLKAVCDENLGQQQRQVIHRILDGKSIPEIADELSTTPARVSDAKYRAVQKIKELV